MTDASSALLDPPVAAPPAPPPDPGPPPGPPAPPAPPEPAAHGQTTRRANRAASMLSTAGDEAATSLLPGFLAGTLGAAPIALGVIEGIASAADGVARLGGGALSEDPRRRRFIGVGGHAGMAFLTSLVGIAGSPWQVGALRAGASTARGLRSPQRYASVPDKIGSHRYGRLFGAERGVHHLAAVMGPLLAFLMLLMLGTRTAFLASIVPGMLAVALGAWVLKRTPRPATKAGTPVRLRTRAVYSGPLGNLMVGITLFELSNFAAVLLILRATKLLEEGNALGLGAAETAVLLYMLWRLSAAAACLVCGRLVDAHGPALLMGTGIALLLASYVGFAFVEGTVPALAACFLGAGAASGAIEAAEHVGVAQVAPEKLRWSAFGSLSAVRSFGRLTATIGAATVWTLLGAAYGLLFAAPLMLASIGVMAAGARAARRSGEDTGQGATRPAGPRRRLVAFAAAGVALLAAAGLAAVALDDATPAPRAQGAGAPQAPAAVAAIPVGSGPDGVTVDPASGSVLVSDARDGTLTRIDPATNRVQGPPLEVGGDADGIAAGRGVVWVAAGAQDRVRRLEGRRELVASASVGVDVGPSAIALGEQLVWVAAAESGTVRRIDRATPAVVGPPIRVGDEPTGVAVGREHVWVTSRAQDTVVRIDPATAQVVGTPLPVGKAPRGVAEGAGSVWVANAGDDTVSRLNPRTGAPVGPPIAVGENPRDLAVGEGFVWVSNHGDDTVTRIDPRTGRVAGAPIAVGDGPLGIAVADGAVWVAGFDAGTVTRIRP